MVSMNLYTEDVLVVLIYLIGLVSIIGYVVIKSNEPIDSIDSVSTN
mgnify:FL=1